MRYSYTIGKVDRLSYSICLKISNTIGLDPTYIHTLCLIKKTLEQIWEIRYICTNIYARVKVMNLIGQKPFFVKDHSLILLVNQNLRIF